MTSRSLGLSWCLLLAGLLAALPGIVQGQTPSYRAVLDAWLTCIECVEGEVDSVKAVAERLPGTVDTLRNDLLQGPSPALRGRLADQLRRTYARLADRVGPDSAAGTLMFTESEFVRHYLGNMIEIYQGRAALALGAIGGRRAREALDEALRLPAGRFPPGVLARIHFARDSLIGY